MYSLYYFLDIYDSVYLWNLWNLLFLQRMSQRTELPQSFFMVAQCSKDMGLL